MKDARYRLGTAVRITNPKSVKHFSGPRPSDAMPIIGMVIKIDEDHWEGQWPRAIQVRFMDGRESWWNRSELKIINAFHMLSVTLPIPDNPITCTLQLVGIGSPQEIMLVAKTVGPEGDTELEAMPVPVDELWNLANGILSERLTARFQVHGRKENHE